MKANRVTLDFFIDALGWELLQLNRPDFLSDLLPYRRPLRTILGYSSACDPSIISGLLPSEHLQWSSYYYSPLTSPFHNLTWLSYLPERIRDHHRIRHYLSQFIAKSLGFTGYFQLYNLPFDILHYFDYAEKKWIYGPAGLLRGRTIFDLAQEHGVAYHVSQLGQSDEENLKSTKESLAERQIQFGYVTLGKLDALGHNVGNCSPSISTLLSWYETELQAVVEVAHRFYDKVDVYLFSDHGMTPVIGTVDLQSLIHGLGLHYGLDYVALYDSTMARFWFFNPDAKQLIEDCLGHVLVGRIIPAEELQQLGVYFPDSRYGETIFLLNAGQLIIPSFMGKKRIKGMHGYHPNEPSSDALILSNRDIDPSIKSIHQIFSVISN